MQLFRNTCCFVLQAIKDEEIDEPIDDPQCEVTSQDDEETPSHHEEEGEVEARSSLNSTAVAATTVLAQALAYSALLNQTATASQNPLVNAALHVLLSQQGEH